MRKVVLLLIVIAVVVGLYELAHRQIAAKGGPPGTVGTTAAPVALTDIDGKPLTLASYNGKVVLLDFWATWCAPCLAEIPHFIEFQDKYGPQGFQVIGVSMDDPPDPVQPFYQQHKMNYPVAIATPQLAESYGGVLGGLPVTFLIDREGRIAAKYRGQTEAGIIQQKLEQLLAQK